MKMNLHPYYALASLVLLSLSISNVRADLQDDFKVSHPGLLPGEPVLHGPIKDQGHFGLCWAYSTSSFFENKILKETGRLVEISPLYFGRNRFLNEIRDDASKFQRFVEGFRNDPVLQEKSKVYREYQLGKMVSDFRMGGQALWDEVMRLGAVPQAAFEKFKPASVPYKKSSIVEYNPNRFEPDFSETLKNIYHTGPSALDAEESSTEQGKIWLNQIDDYFLGTRLAPDTEFQFEGSTYTPKSFLARFLNFKVVSSFFSPFASKKPYVSNRVSYTAEYSSFLFDKALVELSNNLKQGYAVPFEFTVLSDYENDDYDLYKVGVFDTHQCVGEKLCDAKNKDLCIDSHQPGEESCYAVGGHSVLAVNTLNDENGKVKAVVIQNSWGKIGRDSKGQLTENEDDRGFQIIPIEYLKKSAQVNGSGLAFEYYPTLVTQNDEFELPEAPLMPIPVPTFSPIVDPPDELKIGSKSVK